MRGTMEKEGFEDTTMMTQNSINYVLCLSIFLLLNLFNKDVVVHLSTFTALKWNSVN